MSRRLVAAAVGAGAGAGSVIDVGGGASSLVDHLLDLDLQRVAVLDVSEAGWRSRGGGSATGRVESNG